MISLAQAAPRDEGAYHPFLVTVYFVHTAFIAALAALCVYAQVLRPVAAADGGKSYFTPSSASKSGLKQLRILTLVAFIVFLLSSVLQAKLTPTLPAAPMSSEAILPVLFAAIGVLASGWLMDHRPELVIRGVIPVCCWLFILAPALVVFGDSHSLHSLVKTMAAIAQLIVFMICSVGLAGLAHDIRQSVFYACCVYAGRIATVFGYFAWRSVFASDPGIAILAAAALAFLTSLLIRRVNFTIAEDSPSVTGKTELPGEEAVASIVPDPETQPIDKLTAFLDAVNLTPRERETAALLVDGKSVAEIAFALEISERTVKKHSGNLYRKFGIGSRRELQRLFADSQS